jgi:hypothetical protein
MAVEKVITLAVPVQPVPPAEQMGLLNLTVNGFARTASITIAQADGNGEQVTGGAQLSERVARTDKDPEAQAMLAMLPAFLEAAKALFIARGKIAQGATVTDVERK